MLVYAPPTKRNSKSNGEQKQENKPKLLDGTKNSPKATKAAKMIAWRFVGTALTVGIPFMLYNVKDFNVQGAEKVDSPEMVK